MVKGRGVWRRGERRAGRREVRKDMVFFWCFVVVELDGRWVGLSWVVCAGRCDLTWLRVCLGSRDGLKGASRESGVGQSASRIEFF